MGPRADDLRCYSLMGLCAKTRRGNYRVIIAVAKGRNAARPTRLEADEYTSWVNVVTDSRGMSKPEAPVGLVAEERQRLAA